MDDRLFESETFGRPLELSRYARPLVLAPHPDDEVFGCAGLLALWAQKSVCPLVVLLTTGQAQPGVDATERARLRESEASARLLGYQLQAWELKDREVRCDDGLIARMERLVSDYGADVVLAPALSEPHPDHQATTLALCCALARMGQNHSLPDVLLYESGAALVHPNRLVDITDVMEIKRLALSLFESQESSQPYSSRIAARDHFRGMTLGPAASAAEAYTLLEARVLGWPAVVSALEPLYLHGRGQAVVEADLPLVSVLVRTVGDRHLEQTLATVATQTYARLEVVVVAADGREQAPDGLPVRHGQVLRWVSKGHRLNRPQAANAALDAALGDLLIFLDDDDLWAPDHVAKLVNTLKTRRDCAAAHTDTAVVDENGKELTRYDQPYRAERMAFTNTLPIHSVLFERRLVAQQGCRFDENLPVLEDWDFWLQVTTHTDVVHAPGVSALYRWSDRSRLNDEDNRHHQRGWRDTVQGRWLARWPTERIQAAARWYAGQLDQVVQERGGLKTQLAQLREQLLAAEERAQRADIRSSQSRQELEAAATQMAKLHAQCDEFGAIAKASEGLLSDTRLELTVAADRLQRAEADRATWQTRAEAAEHLVRDVRLELALAADKLQRTEADRATWQTRAEAAEHLVRDVRLELAAAGAQLGAAQARLQVSDAAAEAAKKDLDLLRVEHETLRGYAEAAKAENAALLSSTSWQLTRPLRWLAMAWRRL